MKSTGGPAGGLHDIPSMSGMAQYAGIEYAEYRWTLRYSRLPLGGNRFHSLGRNHARCTSRAASPNGRSAQGERGSAVL